MGYISKWNQYVKNMYFHVNRCTIHNSTITETSLMSIKWCMDRENIAQIHNGVLFSRKMEPWVCINMEGHQNHYVNWNSQSGGRLVSHDFNHIWKFKRKLRVKWYWLKAGWGIGRREERGKLDHLGSNYLENSSSILQYKIVTINTRNILCISKR